MKTFRLSNVCSRGDLPQSQRRKKWSTPSTARTAENIECFDNFLLKMTEDLHFLMNKYLSLKNECVRSDRSTSKHMLLAIAVLIFNGPLLANLIIFDTYLNLNAAVSVNIAWKCTWHKFKLEITECNAACLSLVHIYLRYVGGLLSLAVQPNNSQKNTCINSCKQW